jgi:hypothetical protein
MKLKCKYKFLNLIQDDIYIYIHINIDIYTHIYTYKHTYIHSFIHPKLVDYLLVTFRVLEVIIKFKSGHSGGSLGFNIEVF